MADAKAKELDDLKALAESEEAKGLADLRSLEDARAAHDARVEETRVLKLRFDSNEQQIALKLDGARQRYDALTERQAALTLRGVDITNDADRAKYIAEQQDMARQLSVAEALLVPDRLSVQKQQALARRLEEARRAEEAAKVLMLEEARKLEAAQGIGEAGRVANPAQALEDLDALSEAVGNSDEAAAGEALKRVQDAVGGGEDAGAGDEGVILVQRDGQVVAEKADAGSWDDPDWMRYLSGDGPATPQAEPPPPAPAPPLRDTSDLQGYWDDLLQARQQSDLNFQRTTAQTGANPNGLHLAAYDHLQLRRLELREQMLSLVLPHAEDLGRSTGELLDLDTSARAFDVPFQLRDEYLRVIDLAEQAGDADKAEVLRHTLAAFDSMARLEVDAALARADELASFPGVPLPEHLDQARVTEQLQELIQTAMGRMTGDLNEVEMQLAGSQVHTYGRAVQQVGEGLDPTPYMLEIVDRAAAFGGDGSAASKADSIESYDEVLRNVVSVLENPDNFTGPPAAVGTDARSLLIAERDELLHAGKFNDALDTQRQIDEIDKAGRVSPGLEDSFVYRDLESAGAAPGEHRARPGQAADFDESPYAAIDESPYAEIGPPGNAPAPSAAGQKSPITWPQAKHPTGGDGGARLLETAQPGDPLPLGYEWRGGFARAVPDAVDMVDEGADVRISRSIPAEAGPPVPPPRHQRADLPATDEWRSMFDDPTYDTGFFVDDPVYDGGFLAPSPSPAPDVAETESLRSLEVEPSQIDLEDLAEDLYAGGYRYGDPGVPPPPPGRPLEGLSEDLYAELDDFAGLRSGDPDAPPLPPGRPTDPPEGLYVEIPPSRFGDPDAPPRLPPGKPTDLYPEIDDFVRLRSGDPDTPPPLPPGRGDLPSITTKRSADALDGSQPDVARWREPQSPGRATPQLGPDGARWGGDGTSAGHSDIYNVLQRPGGDDASAGHYNVLQRPGDDASAGHYSVLQRPSGDGALADNEGEHLYEAIGDYRHPYHTLEDPNAALPDDIYATPRGKVSRLDAHIADPTRQAPVKKETLSLHLASPHELEALELPADGSYFTVNGRVALQDGKAVPVEDGLPVIRISSALQEQIDQGLTTLRIKSTNQQIDIPSDYILKVDPTIDPPPPQIPYDLEQFREFARSRREQSITDWRQGALAGDAGGAGEDARAILDGLPDGHRFEPGLPVAERAPMPMPNAPAYDEIAAKYLGANAGQPSRSLAPADAINPRGDAPTSVGNVEQVDVWPAPAGVDAHIDPDAGYATIDLADSGPPVSLGDLDPTDVPDGNQLANALAIDPHPLEAVDPAEVDRLADAWFDDALKAAGPDEPALKSIDDTRPHDPFAAFDQAEVDRLSDAWPDDALKADGSVEPVEEPDPGILSDVGDEMVQKMQDWIDATANRHATGRPPPRPAIEPDKDLEELAVLVDALLEPELSPEAYAALDASSPAEVRAALSKVLDSTTDPEDVEVFTTLLETFDQYLQPEGAESAELLTRLQGEIDELAAELARLQESVAESENPSLDQRLLAPTQNKIQTYIGAYTEAMDRIHDGQNPLVMLDDKINFIEDWGTSLFDDEQFATVLQSYQEVRAKIASIQG